MNDLAAKNKCCLYSSQSLRGVAILSLIKKTFKPVSPIQGRGFSEAPRQRIARQEPTFSLRIDVGAKRLEGLGVCGVDSGFRFDFDKELAISGALDNEVDFDVVFGSEVGEGPIQTFILAALHKL